MQSVDALKIEKDMKKKKKKSVNKERKIS